MMSNRLSIPPEEEGKYDDGNIERYAHVQQQQEQQQVQRDDAGVEATVSSPWQYDDAQDRCTGCRGAFNALNRRHHCRLCGKIFCGKCSDQRALIPPSSIVLIPAGGKKVKPGFGSVTNVSFSPEEDPDRMLTYLRGGGGDGGEQNAQQQQQQELIYGRGLEERFTLAREPLRVCGSCFERLRPLQEDLRNSNSNAVRFNHVDPVDPRRLLNSPLAFTLGHEIRKAAYTLNNLLPLPKRGRMGAVLPQASSYETSSSGSNPYAANDPYGFYREYNQDHNMQQCKETCSSISPNLGDLDGVRIPARLLEEARGIAVMTVVKTGFGLAGVEFGTGLVVARVDGNNNNPAPPSSSGTNSGISTGSGSAAAGWSAPCAIGTAGVSWGALIGAQVSDHVFLLMTDAAVRLLFDNKGSVQLGADVGVAVGPLGRALEGNVGASAGPSGAELAPILSYSLSKGLYAGISLDGKVIATRERVNEKFYGRAVEAREILRGDTVPIPPAAQPLYEALTRCHVYATNQKSGESGGAGRARHHMNMQQHGAAATTLAGAQYHYPSMLPQLQQQDGTNNIPPGAPNVTIPPTIQEDASLQHPPVTTIETKRSLDDIHSDGGDDEDQQRHPLQMPPLQPDQHSYAGEVSALTSDPGY